MFLFSFLMFLLTSFFIGVSLSSFLSILFFLSLSSSSYFFFLFSFIVSRPSCFVSLFLSSSFSIFSIDISFCRTLYPFSLPLHLSPPLLFHFLFSLHFLFSVISLVFPFLLSSFLLFPFIITSHVFPFFWFSRFTFLYLILLI